MEEKEMILVNASVVKRGIAFLIDAVVAFFPALVIYIILSSGYKGYAPIAYPAPIIGVANMIDLPVMMDERLNTMETDQGGKTEFRNVSVFATGSRAVSVFVIVFYLGYQTFAHIVYDGRTVGKKFMGIRVVREDGKKPDKSYLIREVVGKVILNSTIIVPIISVVTIIVTTNKKAIHDIIAKTIVIEDI